MVFLGAVRLLHFATDPRANQHGIRNRESRLAISSDFHHDVDCHPTVFAAGIKVSSQDIGAEDLRILLCVTGHVLGSDVVCAPDCHAKRHARDRMGGACSVYMD